MPRPSLHGVEVKLAMARRHAQVFQGEHMTFMDQKLHRFSVDVYNEGRKHVWRVDGDPPALPDHWSGLAGDFFHNLRSVLDHLAWQLVILNRGTPNELTQFPIRPREFRDVDGVAEHTVVISGGVGDAALAEIEAVQPYNSDKGFRDSRLWWLHRLDAIDKHRHLLLHAAAVYGVRYRGQFRQPSRIITPMKPMKDGDVVMVLTFDNPVECKPDADMEPMVFVVLGDIGQEPLEGMQLSGLMAEMYTEVEIILDGFRPMFGIDPVGRGREFLSDYFMRLDIHRNV